MASQGPLSPSTAANDAAGGTQLWSNPSSTLASDNSYATVTGSTTTQYIKTTNFGFSIPAGATIDGIVVEVERSVTGGGIALDANCRLVKAGTIQATNRNDGNLWGTTEAYASHGGAADLWGGTWTPSDVNDSGFGYAQQATISLGSDLARIDHVRITVHYTVAGAGATAHSRRRFRGNTLTRM